MTEPAPTLGKITSAETPTADPYQQVVVEMKAALESMDEKKWEEVAKKATENTNFVMGVPTASIDNLPIVLAALLPDFSLQDLDMNKVAETIGRDTTINSEDIRPLGGLLVGNLTLMRERLTNRDFIKSNGQQ